MGSDDKVKELRASLACDNCRGHKLKCKNDGCKGVCKRCTKLGLSCTYSPTSSQLKKHYKQRSQKRQRLYGEGVSWSDFPVLVLPEKSIWFEVADLFFKNQYQGIFPFIHKPSFYAFLRSTQFNPSTYIADYSKYKEEGEIPILKRPDPLVLLGILALCARLHPTLIHRYGEFDEDNKPDEFRPNMDARRDEKQKADPHSASKYFGWHARMILRGVFDRPSVQRVQALTMLSSHEWGEKNVARSFSYIGIAARMSLLLRLGETNSICYQTEKQKGNDVKTVFIMQEVKRRTLWSVYMMDRCISSGRNRSTAVRVDDIQIAFPCSERDFAFGDEVECMTYQEFCKCIAADKNDEKLSDLSPTSYTIAAFEIWAKIAKWAGEGGAKNDSASPWARSSTYYKLSRDLDALERALPRSLEYGTINIDAHIASNTAGSFGYLHCLLCLGRTFLNREYLYMIPSESKREWWIECTHDLIQSIKKSSNIVNTLASLNLMVVAPFTGFEIFTNAGTALYLSAFPYSVLTKNIVNSESLQDDFNEISHQNGRLLKHWGDVWSLANCWNEWIIEMRDICGHLTVKIGRGSEGSSLKRYLLDYGSSIIQDENDESSAPSISPRTGSVTATQLEPEGSLALESSLFSPTSFGTYRGDGGFDSNFDIGSLFPGWYDTIHADDSNSYI